MQIFKAATPAKYEVHLKNGNHRSTWVAQLVKRPTLDSGSGHDLAVCGFEPCIRLCTDMWSLLEIDSLSPSLSLSAPPLLTRVHRCTFSLARTR